MRFLPTDQQEPLSRRQKLALIGGLSLTQMTGWGTTFYLPSVLGGPIGDELGLPAKVLFGGVTLMLVISAMISPMIGRRVDREGARALSTYGSLLLAAGLFVLSHAEGAVSYLLAFALFGVGATLAMANVSLAAVAQGCPEDGRRPITVLMLVGGLSSGVFWPLTGWLVDLIGWRSTVLAFAVAHAVICAPLHALVIRRSPGAMMQAAAEAAIAAGSYRLDPAQRSRAFLLIVTGAGVSGLASWGMPLQLIPMFQQAGIIAATAILIASLQAPAAMVARLFDLMLARRVPAVLLVAFAALAVPAIMLSLSILVRPPITTTEIAGLTICVIAYGICTALITAARSTLPLELFGPVGYATLLGRMAFWLNLLFSASPLLFAMVRQHGGTQAVLLVGFALSVIAAVAFWRLERLASRAGQG